MAAPLKLFRYPPILVLGACLGFGPATASGEQAAAAAPSLEELR
jgi:hypothetical protein